MAKITRSTTVPAPPVTPLQAAKRKREADIERLCAEHEVMAGYIDDEERACIARRYDDRIAEETMFNPPPPIIPSVQQLQTPIPALNNKHIVGGLDKGRPKVVQGGCNMSIYLDKESLDKARLLGNGNVSLGIRIALNNK